MSWIPAAVMFGLFAANIPVAFAIAMAALSFFLMVQGTQPEALIQRLVSVTQSFPLLAIPFFIFLGVVIHHGGMGRRIMNLADTFAGHMIGGLAQVNVLLATLMAGMSGSSTAEAAMQCKILVPEMSRRGYDKAFSVAVTACSALIATMIPPSIGLILYGVLADVSIGRLFVAGIIPGVLLAALFSGYIIVWALAHPEKIPAVTARTTIAEKLYASRHLIPVMLLIALVLGSIYVGVATATEAAAFGVVGSLIISATQSSLTRKTFFDSMMGATRLYCMIALILSGAAFLTLAMGYIGLPRHLAEWIGSLGLTPFALVVALTAFYIVLGCFLDGISMVVLTMGVILPTVEKAGIDLLWFGIFIVLVVEMAQVTPPVGFNLFVLQGMTGKQITWIARHTLPMFLLMVVAVMLIWFVPDLITFLPRQMKMG